VLPFGVVEMQGTGHRLQHRLRRAGQIATLQSGVAVDADASQHRDLLPPQTVHPPPLTMGSQPGLLRGEPGPATDQEVLNVSAAIHGHDAKTHPAGEPGPVSTRITRSFLDEVVTSLAGARPHVPESSASRHPSLH
jgi:hypothetical protein